MSERNLHILDTAAGHNKIEKLVREDPTWLPALFWEAPKASVCSSGLSSPDLKQIRPGTMLREKQACNMRRLRKHDVLQEQAAKNLLNACTSDLDSHEMLEGCTDAYHMGESPCCMAPLESSQSLACFCCVCATSLYCCEMQSRPWCLQLLCSACDVC